MEILSFIDWRTVLITLAVAIILYNTIQIIRYTIIKKKAEREMKRIDAEIATVHKELEKTKKALQEELKKLQKPGASG